MVPVIWSPRALRHLREIVNHIALDSPANAEAFAERMIKAVERLSIAPRSGRIVEEDGEFECREMIFRPYRIRYEIRDDRVWIESVVHGAQDWRPDA